MWAEAEVGVKVEINSIVIKMIKMMNMFLKINWMIIVLIINMKIIDNKFIKKINNNIWKDKRNMVMTMIDIIMIKI